MEYGSVLLNMNGEYHNLIRGDFPFMKSITQPTATYNISKVLQKLLLLAIV